MCRHKLFSSGDGLTFFDIRKPGLLRRHWKRRAIGAILVPSATPNAAYCEQQREAAYAVNVEGTLELIRQAGRHFAGR